MRFASSATWPRRLHATSPARRCSASTTPARRSCSSRPCYTGAGRSPRELVAAALGARARGGRPARAVVPRASSSFSTRPTARTATTGRATSSTSFRTSFSTSFSSASSSFGRAPSHVLIESLHGAPNDADASQGPIRFRHASFNVSAMAVWRGPSRTRLPCRVGAFVPRRRWSRGRSAAATRTTCRRTSRTNACVPLSATRRSNGCRQLKARYDPQNVLHRNQNIPPPGG